MKRITHLVFGGGITYSIIIYMYKPTFLHIIVILAYTLIPDTDLKYKHRRLLHNVFSAIFLSYLIYQSTILINKILPLEINAYSIALTAITAYTTHLLLDSLTKRGVDLFWPISKKSWGIKTIKSNSKTWNTILIIMGISILILTTLYK